MKRFVIPIMGLLAISGCDDSNKESIEMHNKEEKYHHAGHHANEHMNKTSFEDLVKRFESPERDEWQKPQTVIKFLGDIKNKLVLDIGAGTGYFEFKISDTTVKLIATDVDQRFIDYLNDRKRRENKRNLEIRLAKYEEPAVQKGEADVIFTVDVYHHIENRTDYFKKVKSGLKDGGSLVIVDFKKGELDVGPPDEIKIPIDEIISEVEAAGFRIAETDTSSLKYQFMLKFN